MVRERVAALIIKDKKILLVKDKFASHIYPPGGSIKKYEDHEQALRRELLEELNVELTGKELYTDFNLINKVYNVSQIDYYYIVSISGNPTPSSEVCDFGWYGLDEILSGNMEIPPANLEFLFPKLKKDKLL